MIIICNNMDKSIYSINFLLTSEKLCVTEKYTLNLKNHSFFSILAIGNFIYNNLENIIRIIKIYYYIFIINIKISVLVLLSISMQKMYNIKPKIHEDVIHLFAKVVLK